MFAVIRHYHFNPKDGAEIDRRIREEFVPIVKNAKGFVRYYWLDTGNGEGASLGVFKDKAGADESMRLAADYVKSICLNFSLRNPRFRRANQGSRLSTERASGTRARLWMGAWDARRFTDEDLCCRGNGSDRSVR